MKFYDNLLENKRYTKEECIEPNETTQNLWSWARRLEVFGIIGAAIIVVIGLFIAGTAADGASKEGYSSLDSARIAVFFSSWLPWILYGFLEYCGFHAVALLISAVGNVTYNTMVTAKVSLSTANLPDSAYEVDLDDLDLVHKIATRESSKKKEPGHGFWICPNCGKRNDLAEERCECGKARSLF